MTTDDPNDVNSPAAVTPAEAPPDAEEADTLRTGQSAANAEPQHLYREGAPSFHPAAVAGTEEAEAASGANPASDDADDVGGTDAAGDGVLAEDAGTSGHPPGRSASDACTGGDHVELLEGPEAENPFQFGARLDHLASSDAGHLEGTVSVPITQNLETFNASSGRSSLRCGASPLPSILGLPLPSVSPVSDLPEIDVADPASCDPAELLKGAREAVHRRFQSWKASWTTLYRALWGVFQWGRLINGNPEALQLLRAELQAAHGSSQWKADDKGAFELLLVQELGLEDDGPRSNYLTFLKEVSERSLENEERFLQWVKQNHGIAAIIKERRRKAKGIGAASLAVGRWIQQRRDSYSGKKQLPVLEVGANTIPLVTGEAAVWIVRAADPTHVEVIERVDQQEVLKKVLPFVIRRIKEHEQAADRQKDDDKKFRKAMRIVNLTTLRLNGMKSGQVARRWMDKFAGAVQKLYHLRKDLFEEEPVVPTCGRSDLQVQHPGWDKLDPGRYVQGAKQGALIDYPFDPNDPAGNEQAAKAYLKPKRNTEKPEPPSDSGSGTIH